MKQARWLIAPDDPAAVRKLTSGLGILPPAARVLASRGYRDVESARRFLRPSLDDLHDPYLLLGLKEAVERIECAIARHERILLYGDYDVDGTTSVVILKKAIELAGGQAGFHVPHRLKDGYGMRSEVVERAAADGVTLLISLDTGIRAAPVVCRARELGIDVIVTDHHLPDEQVPPALAVLNPKQAACGYPDKNLCGAGVAFKLVQALLARRGWPPEKLTKMTRSFLKLVAIGTVADVVPLTGENRVIVRHGLQGLKRVHNPGLRALLSVAGWIEGTAPSAGQVAFRIAPRLNAAGRMADANEVIRLLLTDDEECARRIAEQLHALNLERQQTENDMVKLILDECLAVPVTDRHAALVFSGKDWHRGVVGIVATRLVERFHRPVFVLSEDAAQGIVQGSGRSVPDLHLLDALESMAGLLTRFGGHRQAAGVALRTGRLEEFREQLNTYVAARLSPGDFLPQFEVDAGLDLSEVNDQSIEEVLALEPFGCGNPEPLFRISGAEVAGPPSVWKERHLRIALRQSGRTLFLKAWNFGERASEFKPYARVDAVVAFEPDGASLSRGFPGWTAILRDARPAQ